MPPIQIPRWREAAILSRLRSPEISRSNWAKESRIFRVSRPIDVLVLKGWLTDTKALCKGGDSGMRMCWASPSRDSHSNNTLR